MSIWEMAVANSTLAEGDGDFYEHLANPSGDGGGGVVINSELVFIGVEEPVEVSVEDDITYIQEQEDILISTEDDIILIAEIKIGELDVLC